MGGLWLFCALAAHCICGSSSAFESDAVYSPAYFWFWNDTLDPAKLRAQLEDMHAHGLRNVCIHPMPRAFRSVWCSTRMDPDYLTPGFLDVYAKVVHRAGELGMHAYLYDEGGWPSGGACGLVVASDREGRFAQREIALKDGGGVETPWDEDIDAKSDFNMVSRRSR